MPLHTDLPGDTILTTRRLAVTLGALWALGCSATISPDSPSLESPALARSEAQAESDNDVEASDSSGLPPQWPRRCTNLEPIEAHGRKRLRPSVTVPNERNAGEWKGPLFIAHTKSPLATHKGWLGQERTGLRITSLTPATFELYAWNLSEGFLRRVVVRRTDTLIATFHSVRFLAPTHPDNPLPDTSSKKPAAFNFTIHFDAFETFSTQLDEVIDGDPADTAFVFFFRGEEAPAGPFEWFQHQPMQTASVVIHCPDEEGCTRPNVVPQNLCTGWGLLAHQATERAFDPIAGPAIAGSPPGQSRPAQ